MSATSSGNRGPGSASDDPVTRFKVCYHDSRRAGRLALVTMDNGADHHQPNVFGAAAIASLNEALDEVEAQNDLKGLLLTGKPFIFAAGADLNAFESVTPEFAREAAHAGHRAFGRLRALPFPTLAAVNGVCLGGGLEIALHCDYRALSTFAAPIAFPEVFLSIFPAWGGTQLTPRLVGIEAALQLIVRNALDNNRMLPTEEAFERGLFDRMIPAVDFLDASVVLLERLITGEERIERAEPDHGDIDEAVARARQAADDRVHGATRAPYVAVELIEFAARGGELAEGLAREEDALAELLPARQAQASVYAFHLTQQRVRKQPWRPDAPPRDVRQVAIVGSGLMGAQLGALFLQRLEVPLVMKDIDEGVLDRARQHIEEELGKRVQRGRLAEGKARFLASIVTYTLDYAPVADSDFVLEAVLEQLDLKRRVFADVEQVVDPGCVLATNTSSLSIAAMAEGLAHPERVVGLHFFNPVAVLPLAEVIHAEATSGEALATTYEVAKRLRKSAVGCNDTPAFIVNRVLARFMGACAEAVNRGNEFAEVDDAIKELGLPMGPFELMGFVGLKVAVHTVETLAAAFPDRFHVHDNLRLLAEADVDGIYDWSKGRVPHEVVRDGWQVEEGAEKLTPDQIRQQALEAVAHEVRTMLDEGAVADARDVDTGLLLGAGWPFFMGGVCKYLDQTGISDKLFGAPLIGEVDRAFD